MFIAVRTMTPVIIQRPRLLSSFRLSSAVALKRNASSVYGKHLAMSPITRHCAVRSR